MVAIAIDIIILPRLVRYNGGPFVNIILRTISNYNFNLLINKNLI